MAAPSLVQEFCEETTCPICLEYFSGPVILECGHNFCQACLSCYWEERKGNASCPQCRETITQSGFRPNRQLANVVEIAKKFSLQAGKGGAGGGGEGGGGGGRVCETHQEPLKLFCKDDAAPICVVCDRSKEHREHQVIPMEEAAQEYQENIQAQLQSLQEEREKRMHWKMAEERRSQKWLAELGVEKQKTTAAFKRMHKNLEEKACFWLAELEELEQEIEEKQGRNAARRSEEISHLSQLITEIEGKCQRPASNFLEDTRRPLNRYQKEQLLEISPDLEERLGGFSQKCSLLKNIMEKLEGSLIQMLNKERVTLDLDTAHPFLALSEDRRCVQRGRKKQAVPNNAERFDSMLYVLGDERFVSGRHWWEVEVEEEEEEKEGATWAVGIAKESVRRKGYISINPNEGIWAVGKTRFGGVSSEPFWALTCPERSLLTWRGERKKIRVLLDYEEGSVAFFDADTDDWIYTFPSATFSGEEIRPFFFVWWGAGLKC
ncbi:zinc finger protein RFP-like [Elgaria multicarinata webbii]|uniref:zinc finger protein RFP-like n=1 Tax=Elgaria multicarinata webbii TaxID=159646 RepID=UPI002FCCE90F